ncbi:MAG: ATP phosphoribosyltransferase regulatory subunit, partial [Clostridia bacterium]|nr:ATP phosphoribosyltransferase regulatory subunit [Clostridia bacterium]
MKKKTKTTGILDELRPSEILELKLRSLYKKSGYANFKMGKFEEYDLYLRSKDFIPSRSIITFSGAEGKLMALRPDITLSIVKNHGDDPDKTDKLYYSEKIYRCEADGDYREIMQIGLECLGYLGAENVCDVLGLAAQTMENVTRDYVLEISHLGILQAVTSGLDEKTAQEVVRLIGDKNRDGLRALAESGAIAPETLCGIEGVMNASGPARTVIASLRKTLKDKASAEALDELEQVTGYLKSLGLRGRVILDFS